MIGCTNEDCICQSCPMEEKKKCPERDCFKCRPTFHKAIERCLWDISSKNVIGLESCRWG